MGAVMYGAQYLIFFRGASFSLQHLLSIILLFIVLLVLVIFFELFVLCDKSDKTDQTKTEPRALSILLHLDAYYRARNGPSVIPITNLLLTIVQNTTKK
jgi:uncharacterized membrane protein